MSDSTSWSAEFFHLFNSSVAKYIAGHQKPTDFFDHVGREFLKSIGYTDQELFDFIDDFARGGLPTPETALAIAQVRRDYFLNEQQGRFSTAQIDMANLPSKDAEVEGTGWLPRLIPQG